MADLKNALPKTWSSPTMSPHCDDEKKYGIVEQVIAHFQNAQKKGEQVAGQKIRDLVTVNGVRVTVEDGTWGLVRASSNKPELVVVVESPASEAAHARDVRGHRRRAAHISGRRRIQPEDLGWRLHPSSRCFATFPGGGRSGSTRLCEIFNQTCCDTCVRDRRRGFSACLAARRNPVPRARVRARDPSDGLRRRHRIASPRSCPRPCSFRAWSC